MPPLPPVTRNLMIVCAVLYAASLFLPLEAWFGLHSPASGRLMPWQLLTYAFLHGSMVHLLFNMLGLWMFGAELERLWGQRRYLQLLGASVVTAALAQLGVNLVTGSYSLTVGASGALYGLLLAYALMFPRRQFDLVGFLPTLLLMVPVDVIQMLGMILFVVMLTNRSLLPIPPMPVPAKTMVLIFGGLELFAGVVFSRSGVAHFAHLGGMLGAWLLIAYWRGRGPFARRR